MGSLGFPEMLVIAVIALMVFGPRKLPELGKALGQSINEFKKGAANLRETVEAEIQQDKANTPVAAVATVEANKA